MTGTEMIRNAVKNEPNKTFSLEVQSKEPSENNWTIVKSTLLSVKTDSKKMDNIISLFRKRFISEVIRNSRYQPSFYRLCLMEERTPILVEYATKDLLYYALSLGDYRHFLDELVRILEKINLIKENEETKEIQALENRLIGDLTKLKNKETVSVEKTIEEATDIWLKNKDQDCSMSYFREKEKPKKPIVSIIKRKEENKK